MKEALRRYPPLPTMPRYATRAFDFMGYTIPAGTHVGITPIHTHHMEEIWSQPFRFDPERFAPGREEHKRHPFAWVPFGGGAHMCLGQHFAYMQVKALMAQLLEAVPAGMRVILVGDREQLPSVDAGAVLSDLLPPRFENGAPAELARTVKKLVGVELPEPSQPCPAHGKAVLLSVQQRAAKPLQPPGSGLLPAYCEPSFLAHSITFCPTTRPISSPVSMSLRK